VKNKEIKAEVVSDEEYALSEIAGFATENIVFNGPIKGEETLLKAVRGGSYVNVDSQSDIACLSKIQFDASRIGIRVNVDVGSFDEKDIGYTEDGFRFGFSEENGSFWRAVQSLNIQDKAFGLHLHCNSVTRNTTVYSSIARYAASLIKKYALKPSYIDIGGGFAGGIAGKPTPKQYIKAIRDELSPVIDIEKTKLIIEPGSAFIGSAVELHTSVLDVKDTKFIRIVTTDGSRIFLDPLWKKSRYSYQVNAKKNNTFEKQLICGYTCMDHDRIMQLTDAPELSVGDEIVYLREGSYSMTLGGMFIKFLCDVYVKEGAALKRVRKKISAKEYYAIQNCEE
jgi:diaminopimelate decarboxylase